MNQKNFTLPRWQTSTLEPIWEAKSIDRFVWRSHWSCSLSVIPVPLGTADVTPQVQALTTNGTGEAFVAGNDALCISIFNGLRALSANIAVELSEAVRDSTLYRMLFLAALTLFVITFVVNTLAEMVRQRFRKRTAQL